MHVVAVHHLQGTPEQLARDLAAVFGITPYEARSRVIAPAGGPAVVASFAGLDPAAACAAQLRGAGFTPLLVADQEIETDTGRALVRELQFAQHGLRVETRNMGTLSVPYADIDLVLRGAGIVTSSEIETKTEKKFDLGRAVVSGGMMLRKKTTTVTEHTSSERQPFCHLYRPGRPPVVLRQNDMDYSSLGADRQLSRDANFNWICAELRRRCPAATWDDRLQTRPGLAQLLGPAFDPERHLDLAITLLARSARGKATAPPPPEFF